MQHSAGDGAVATRRPPYRVALCPPGDRVVLETDSEDLVRCAETLWMVDGEPSETATDSALHVTISTVNGGQVRAELGPDHIWFADDIFGLRPGWVEELAAGLEARDLRIPFTVQSRVDLMTPVVCAALARAGAEEVWLGVESGSQAVLDAMNKGTTVAQARAATTELRRHGVRPS